MLVQRMLLDTWTARLEHEREAALAITEKPSSSPGRKRKQMILGTRVGVNKLSPLNPQSRIGQSSRLSRRDSKLFFRHIRGVTRSRVRRFVWVHNRHGWELLLLIIVGSG